MPQIFVVTAAHRERRPWNAVEPRTGAGQTGTLTKVTVELGFIATLASKQTRQL